jgi:hypothetical protein
MKTVVSFLGLLLSVVITSSSFGAQSKANLSATDFTVSCVEVVIASRNATVAPQNLKDFLPEDSIFVGKEKREVKIFRLKPNLSADHRILVIIERGPEADVEIPRVTAVCLNEVPHPSTTGKSADIEFNSRKNETISMRFHLNKKKNNPGYLQYTNWKKTGDESIWMVGPFAPGASHDPPGPKDWPSCMPKNVTLAGATISFDFSGCANPGSGDLQYEYALHMDQTSGNATVDIGIDPMIINHP